MPHVLGPRRFTPTPEAGTLAPGEAVAVGLIFNEFTDALALGEFAATVTFSDLTHELSEHREVRLAMEPKGVLAYWPLDGDGSELPDLSGNEHHGQLFDDVAPSRSEGRFGSGLPLTPGLERVEIPGEIVQRHQTSSFSLWFQTTSIATQMLLSGGAEDRLGALRLFIAGDGAQLKFHSNSHTATWSELTLADGGWHHVVATMDGEADTLTLYLDGVALDSQTLAWAGRLDMEGGRMAMGVQLAPDMEGVTGVVEDTTLDGSLDDVRVYNHVLDAGEVADVFVGGPALVPSPFDDERHVALDRTLSWVPGASALSHDVYLGRSRDAVRDADESSDEFMGNHSAASFEPLELEQDQYFWRVDEISVDGVIAGPVWRFDSLEEDTGTDSDTGEDPAEDAPGGCACAAEDRPPVVAGLWLALMPLLLRRRRQ